MNFSLVTKKTVFGVANQVLYKQSCTAIADCKRLEISDLGRREIILSCHCRAALVFASHMQNRFSHDATHLKDGITIHEHHLEILGQFLESVLSVNFLNQRVVGRFLDSQTESADLFLNMLL